MEDVTKRAAAGWQFAEDIAEEVRKGYRFVVLAGAGLSLASGVPTLEGTGRYLEQCIAKVLKEGDDDDREPGTSKGDDGEPGTSQRDRWEPRTSKWPPVAETLAESAGWVKWDWINGVVAALQKAGPPEEGEERADAEARLSAVGAMSDWRAALRFLAQVRRLPGNGRLLELLPPDQGVADALFAHIVEGHQPNAAHVLLAHLAYPLRIRTVLTTNFDELIEQAFAEQQFPLVPFPVYHDAPLPAARLVLAQPSIVKLHGGRHGLRADVSLDQPPSSDDLKAFAEYFLPPRRDDDPGEGVGPNRATHLLVLGASGRDERVLSLIRHARSTRHIGKVFWVCYRRTEIKALKKDLCKEAPCEDGSLSIISHHHPASFLLGLYQRTCYCLPPSGAELSAFWDIPARAYERTGDDACRRRWKRFRSYVSKVKRRVKREWEKARASGSKQPEAAGREPRTTPILIVDGGRGLSSVGTEVYEKLLDEGKSCVWLGMDDYCTPRDFEVSLVQAIAWMAGVPTAPISPMLGSASVVEEEVAPYLRRARDPVIVFLDARDGFGTSANMHDFGWDFRTDAKGKPLRPSRWRTENRRRFCDALTRLHEKQQEDPELRKLLFVLVLDTERRRADAQVIHRRVGGGRLIHGLEDSCLPFGKKKVICRAMKWMRDGDSEQEMNKRRFLYALTLFRRSRYLAALCTWVVPVARGLGLSDDRDVVRAGCSKAWVSELEEKKVVRTKPGGLTWMHTELRGDLRAALEDKCPKLRDYSWQCHQSIADWYVKLFRYTNDPLPALESIYHRIECFNRAEDYLKRKECEEEREMRDHARETRGTALTEALVTLRLCRERVLASGYIEACRTILGVLEGQMRELRAKEGPLGLRAAKLHGACLELLRDLARSQGSFVRALACSKDLLKEQQRATKGKAGTGSRSEGKPSGVVSPAVAAAHREAVYLTGLRCYGPAEERFREVLEEMGFEKVAERDALFRFAVARKAWEKESAENPASPDGMPVPPSRAAAREWVMATDPSQAKCQQTIKTLRRYMFLQMLLAQAERSAEKERILAQVKEGKPGAGRLQFAEVMYDATTEIMRYVEDQDFLGIQNAYIRTDYSVVLANLGRFSEAHRRLNEATGYLRCSPKNGDLLAWSVADLRRAEVYLREAESHVGEAEEDDKVGRSAECGTYKRSHAVACIDSAYAALRQAESRVIGQPRETWWLTWMHELDLWVCELLTRTRFCPPKGEASHASHVCRRCTDPYQRVNEVVEKALRLIRYDVFRLASLGDVVQRIHEYTHLSKPAREAISNVAVKLNGALEVARRARREDEGYKDYPLHPTVETYVEYIADWPRCNGRNSRVESRE